MAYHGASADQWKNCNVNAAQLYQHVSAYSGIRSCHLLPSQLLAAVAHRQSACAAAASPLRQCAGEAPALLVALGMAGDGEVK